MIETVATAYVAYIAYAPFVYNSEVPDARSPV